MSERLNNNTAQHTTAATTPTASAPRAAWLIATAAVLLALIGIQTWPTSPDAAVADLVSSSGNYTILTSPANNEEIVVVLDGRAEELFVYRGDPNNGIQLYQRMSVPQVFLDARARAQGRN